MTRTDLAAATALALFAGGAACTRDTTGGAPAAPIAAPHVIAPRTDAARPDAGARASIDDVLHGDGFYGAPYVLVPAGELTESADAWCAYRVVQISDSTAGCPVVRNEVIALACDPDVSTPRLTRRIRISDGSSARCMPVCRVWLVRVGAACGPSPTGLQQFVRCD
jgi:hypothetical protein